MLKTLRLRSAQGLSWGTLALNVSNGVLWLGYGVVLGQLPIVCANTLYSLANGALVFCKLRYDGGGDARPATAAAHSKAAAATPSPARHGLGDGSQAMVGAELPNVVSL